MQLDENIVPYKRVMIKISGEMLGGHKGCGVDHVVASDVARKIADVRAVVPTVCLVVGGGNILRGCDSEHSSMERVSSDHAGMLATIINAIVLESALRSLNVPAVVLSALPVDLVCQPYTHRGALQACNEGNVVIFAGGIGSPFFSTDTTAVIRALGMKCDVFVKATHVDGIYSDDPKKCANAERYATISYSDVIARGLNVMDATAVLMARDNGLRTLVCSLSDDDGLVSILQGKGKFTILQEN
jgi:uridylate kinase